MFEQLKKELLKKIPKRLQRYLCDLEIEMIVGSSSTLTIESTIMVAIKRGQTIVPLCEQLKYEVRKKRCSNFYISEDRVLG